MLNNKYLSIKYLGEICCFYLIVTIFSLNIILFMAFGAFETQLKKPEIS